MSDIWRESACNWYNSSAQIITIESAMQRYTGALASSNTIKQLKADLERLNL